MWVPDLSKIAGPRYLAVASAIADAIDSGELPPGTQLPTQRELAKRLGITVGTIGRAYALARKRRLITGEVGRGTFVEGPRRDLAAARTIPAADPRTIDLGCYRSPVEGLSEALTQAFAEVADRTSLLPLHRYPPGTGFLSHRAAGAAWLARVGLNVPPQQVLLTAGAQQAIATAVATFCTGDDMILTEALTYSGLKAIAALQGVRLGAVAMDEEGMIPRALDAAAAATGAKVVYLQPSVHNPTTALMSQARREEIATIARKHELVLIEDDASAPALTDRPPPIATLAPEHVCYITSISKAISPAFRLGYIASSPPLIERLLNTFHAYALAVSPLIAEVVSLMIGNGAAERIARRNVAELKRWREIAEAELAGHDVRTRDGAFFLWLMLPEQWAADEFAAAANRQGVSVIPVESFATQRGSNVQAVRASVNPASNPDVLRRGLRTLVGLLQTRPRPHELII
jgi:DNA-binding transcriptional MocR family regulator